MFNKKGLIERWIQRDQNASPHLCIVGRTGAGKTTLCKKIVLFLLERGENVSVLDFDGEYGDLPIPLLTPPFHVPKVPLAWLISQAIRPEEGGYGIAGLVTLLDTEDVGEAISRIKQDWTVPASIRFATLWRLAVLQKYFVYDGATLLSSAVYDLSSMNVRERQIVQQVLASLLTMDSNARYMVIEEGVSGAWMEDLLVMARRRRKRLIFVSQSLPDKVQNFEVVLFTPYITNLRTFPLPLPVSPSTDKGAWWVGGLGVHRLKHLW